ncbi:MAG: hypothetical protein ACI4UY_06945 [Kiritimatiellia bacterium]
MKTVIVACMSLLAAAVAWSAGEATNTVSLTDAEVRMVERARARNAKVAARNRTEAIARKAPGMTRSAPDGAPFAASVRRMVPKTVFGRRRIVGMDTESVPGSVVYTYAQGGSVWCETNALKAVEFKAARNRYSKLKIVVAAKAAGKWDALKAGIAAADLEDEWNACQYIEDGDPSFVAATNKVVAAGVATAEEIAAFLEKAIDN